jgi:PAS domain S-box-containing protein
VRDLELLHDATLRVARTRNWQTALREILQSALAAVGTDKGLLSLTTDDGTHLRVGMSEGFSPEFIAGLGLIRSGVGSCGAALARRARVIVRDADTDALFIGLHDAVRLGRFKSVHSVPLISRTGAALGVLSVHFLRRHETDARELRLLDLYTQMAVDFIERSQAEAALRDSEDRLRAVTDIVPVMLMRCDEQERFEFANRAYLERRGLKFDELVGRPIREVVGEVGYAQIKPYIDRVLRGEEVHYQLVLPYPEFGDRHLSVAYVPERDAQGRVRGWVGSVTDITEPRRVDARIRELAAIVASSSDAIIGADLDGCVTSWNQGAERLFGYQAAEVIGHSLAFLAPADRAGESETISRRVFEGERIDHFLTERLRRDGSRVHVALTVSPILDENGRIVGASAIARDVTDLQLAQQALRERTRMLQAVNQASGALVAELDLEKIAQNVLQAGRDISGATLGGLYLALTSPGAAPRLICVEERARAAFERVPPAEFMSLLGTDPSLAAATLRERTGSEELLASVLAVPVVSRAGDLVGGLAFADTRLALFTPAAAEILQGVAALAALAIDNAKLYGALDRELREKRHADAELRAAQRQLQAHAALLEQKVQERTQSLRDAITQMEEFSYTVSHDLRAPLRAMNTYAQALVEDFGPQLDPTARHYLERIQRSSLRMEKLTHDVLTYSRLARSEIKLAPVDLDALLRDMIYQYTGFQPPHAEIKVKRPLHDVLAHEVSLGQCIANLLTNAVKFVAPGVQPRIRVHTELRDQMVRLWIVDNGIGIDPQYQSRLFQVFERLHDRQQYEGTGIGLAIVRKAVDKMGGCCGVESDGSNGSRFWIELPLASSV